METAVDRTLQWLELIFFLFVSISLFLFFRVFYPSHALGDLAGLVVVV